MRVTIVGGSAPSTPGLFDVLGRRATVDLEGALVGRSRDRLAAVRRASRMLGGKHVQKIETHVGTESGYRAALQGASLVVIQVRVGGYEGRDFDEHMPVPFGCCGDQELGPGALSAGWRSWPVIEEVLGHVEAWAPRALVALLTAPVGLLCIAATRRFPGLRIVGICEVPTAEVVGICERVGADPRACTFGYYGVSHLGWLHDVRIGGRHLGACGGPNGSAEGISTRTTYIHEWHDRVLADQKRDPRRRGDELRGYRENAMRAFRSARPEGVRAALTGRNAPWYELAIGPLVLALAGQPETLPFFLTVPNGSWDAELAADDHLEIPHRMYEGELTRLPKDQPPPAGAKAVVRAYVAHQRRAAEALASRSEVDLKSALSCHPWPNARAHASELSRAIVRHSQGEGG